MIYEDEIEEYRKTMDNGSNYHKLCQSKMQCQVTKEPKPCNEKCLNKGYDSFMPVRMGFDAFRLCMGIKPRHFTMQEIIKCLNGEKYNMQDKLTAAEKLIAVFMEFKFLQEDWKVKQAITEYQQANERKDNMTKQTEMPIEIFISEKDIPAGCETSDAHRYIHYSEMPDVVPIGMFEDPVMTLRQACQYLKERHPKGVKLV